MNDYRERIYGCYSKMFQGRTETVTKRDQDWWYRVYSYYFRNWLPDDKQAAIVDVGCGAGALLTVFKRKGYYNLYGVDLSVPQVEFARHIVKDVVVDNAIDYLKRRNGSFNLITAIDIIEHFKKDEALNFLDACFVALRPGGRLILQTPNAESPWVGSIRYGDMTHETCYTPAGLSRIMNMCGFIEVEGRPCVPTPNNLNSTIRYLLWQMISIGFRICTFIEGYKSSGIYTRVFLLTAIKPNANYSKPNGNQKDSM